MARATLTVDLDALCANWRALDARGRAETGAVVKADGYGLGAPRVARALARAGARTFFVALAEEGAALREALGPGPAIMVFSGHMAGDADMIGDLELTPMLNSVDQMLRHVEALPGRPFGIQLDTGMNRLGMEVAEWAALREIAAGQSPALVMSHMACAETPEHPMNAAQLRAFAGMTEGLDAPRSLAATGGILLGGDYHFDVTRPGIGLYGGMPFGAAHPVAELDVPVIQTRPIEAGETVGYGNTFTARAPMRVATIAAGYGDGFLRAMGPRVPLYAGPVPCPVVGRVSMDLIGVDVTHLDEDPATLSILGPHQGIDAVAEATGTIGYEILTGLGPRFQRRYRGG